MDEDQKRQQQEEFAYRVQMWRAFTILIIIISVLSGLIGLALAMLPGQEAQFNPALGVLCLSIILSWCVFCGFDLARLLLGSVHLFILSRVIFGLIVVPPGTMGMILLYVTIALNVLACMAFLFSGMIEKFQAVQREATKRYIAECERAHEEYKNRKK